MLSKTICDFMLRNFHDLCEFLGVPLAKEKTIWAQLQTVFLGILLDGEHHLLVIPEEKRLKTI